MKVPKAMPIEQKVTLRCGVELTLRAPRLGILQRAMEVVPPPIPPQKIMHRKDGPPAYLADENDPGFKARERRASYLQMVYTVWEVLSTCLPEELEFETPVPAGEASIGFVEKVAKEFETGPLTDGDMKKVMEFVANSAGVTEEELDDAADFSGRGESE